MISKKYEHSLALKRMLSEGVAELFSTASLPERVDLDNARRDQVGGVGPKILKLVRFVGGIRALVLTSGERENRNQREPLVLVF